MTGQEGEREEESHSTDSENKIHSQGVMVEMEKISSGSEEKGKNGINEISGESKYKLEL